MTKQHQGMWKTEEACLNINKLFSISWETKMEEYLEMLMLILIWWCWLNLQVNLLISGTFIAIWLTGVYQRTPKLSCVSSPSLCSPTAGMVWWDRTCPDRLAGPIHTPSTGNSQQSASLRGCVAETWQVWGGLEACPTACSCLIHWGSCCLPCLMESPFLGPPLEGQHWFCTTDV